MGSMVIWKGLRQAQTDKRYGCRSAIGKEKQLKAGNRAKKVGLIQRINPEWNDLYEEVKKEFGD